MAYKVKFTKKQYERLNAMITKAENNKDFKNERSTIKEIKTKLNSARIATENKWKKELFIRIPGVDLKGKFTNFGFLVLYGILTLIISFVVQDYLGKMNLFLLFLPSLIVIALLDTIIFGRFIEISEENDDKELHYSLRYANYKERFILISAFTLFLLSFFFLLFNPNELQNFVDGIQGETGFEKTDSKPSLFTNFPNFATVFALAITIFTVIDSNITNRVNNHNSKINKNF